MIPTYKIALIGDGGVGKTTFVKRHVTGQFELKYIATIGAEVHPYRWKLNEHIQGVENANCCLNLWDTAGQKIFGGLRDGYYTNSDAAIVMFDLQNNESLLNVNRWIKDFKRICPNAPIVLVGTKIDLDMDRIFSSEFNTYIYNLKREGLIDCYFSVSLKSNYQYDKPFDWLANRLISETQDIVCKLPEASTWSRWNYLKPWKWFSK